MRILFINSVYNYGSTGHIVANLMGALKKQGNEVKVAFGRHIEKVDKDSIIIGNRLDILLSVIGSRLFDNHGLMNKRATRKFIKQIDNQDFDIIHIHNLHGYYINYPILFKYLSKKKIPVVWTLHDGWPMTGHAAYDERFFPKISRVSHYGSMLRYPTCILFNRGERNKRNKELFMGMLNVCTITTPSKWLMGYVERSYLGKYDNRVINNGVDLSIFKPKKVDRRSDKKMILGVASVWDNSKGLSDFIQLRSMIGGDYEIVLVGLTKKQILKLPIGIIGIERTNSVEQLADLYNQSDVFLNLTYEDNYPTTNLEALACGTPVITYDTGGSLEAISDSKRCVIKQGDLSAIVDAVHDVIGVSPIVDISDIDMDTMIKKNISLYKEVVLL